MLEEMMITLSVFVFFFTEFFFKLDTKSDPVSFFSPLFITRHSLIYVLKRIIN